MALAAGKAEELAVTEDMSDTGKTGNEVPEVAWLMGALQQKV
jgi:hypothetical protein